MPDAKMISPTLPPVFAQLDRIVDILGNTNRFLIPLLGPVTNQSGDAWIRPYGAGSSATTYNMRNNGGNASLLGYFPYTHPSGIGSWEVEGTDTLTSFLDSDTHSFGNGTVDSPFSCGIWTLTNEALGTARSLFGKYNDTGASEDREWNFRFNTSGNLELELYDESANASEIATGDTAITPFKWQFLTSTYDGNEASPGIHLYIDGVDTNSAGTSVETGSYVAMENGATPLMIGARKLGTDIAQAHQGRKALPFVAGKELTAAEVSALYELGRILIGI